MSRRRREPSRPGASPTLTPATGPPGRSTPASSSASVHPDTVAMDDDPFELVTSPVSRIAYGNASRDGRTGRIARSARAPCPTARRLPVRPASPVA